MKPLKIIFILILLILAFWLQENNETQNPYFGSVMPICGELKETIAPEKQGK